MDNATKRRAIRAYRERKLVMGIFAIRCRASGQVWVGQSRNLDTLQNRIWFALRLGNYSNQPLQDAAARHGLDALSFEPLQQLPDEATAYPEALLGDLAEDWREQLSADRL